VVQPRAREALDALRAATVDLKVLGCYGALRVATH
jgi:hypothetical protein